MISSSERLDYAGLWLLKKLDLSADDGGIELPVVAPSSWAAIEPALEQLAVRDLVAIDRKRGVYQLTPAGLDHIANAIDEAESFIEEFDDWAAADVVAELRRRRLDPMRVRFYWGWYQGEFDDVVLFQQRRGGPVDHDWAGYLMSDAFYDALADDFDEGGRDAAQ